MNWSKIQTSDLAIEAYMKIADNLCDYHNNQHVEAMYDYLDENEVPYDEALDWAVMFHDVIYDSGPKKEKRSAKFFLEAEQRYRGCSLNETERNRVYELILATEDHLIDDENRHVPIKGKREIIMADLHQLTKPKHVVINYANIMQESMRLYDIDEFDFARASIKFMQEFRDRITKNIRRSDTIGDKAFFSSVVDGINSTILLSRAIL